MWTAWAVQRFSLTDNLKLGRRWIGSAGARPDRARRHVLEVNFRSQTCPAEAPRESEPKPPASPPDSSRTMLKLLVLVSSAVAFRPLVAPSRAVCMRATPDLDDFDVRAPSVGPSLCSASGSRRGHARVADAQSATDRVWDARVPFFRLLGKTRRVRDARAPFFRLLGKTRRVESGTRATFAGARRGQRGRRQRGHGERPATRGQDAQRARRHARRVRGPQGRRHPQGVHRLRLARRRPPRRDPRCRPPRAGTGSRRLARSAERAAPPSRARV